MIVVIVVLLIEEKMCWGKQKGMVEWRFNCKCMEFDD